MKLLAWIAGLVVAALVVWRAGDHVYYNSHFFRYKFSFTIRTPDGYRTASSVIEVILLPQRRDKIRVYGPNKVVAATAPIFDLGALGTLVVPIETSAYGGFELAVSLPIRVYGLDYYDPWDRLASVPRDPVPVPSKHRPFFVWLPAGATDPEQAKLLRTADELGGQLKDEVSFVSATIEPTRDFAAVRIDPAPAWLVKIRDRYRPGGNPIVRKGPGWYLDLGALESEFPPKFSYRRE
jgi:hypothetical protein